MREKQSNCNNANVCVCVRLFSRDSKNFRFSQRQHHVLNPFSVAARERRLRAPSGPHRTRQSLSALHTRVSHPCTPGPSDSNAGDSRFRVGPAKQHLPARFILALRAVATAHCGGRSLGSKYTEFEPSTPRHGAGVSIAHDSRSVHTDACADRCQPGSICTFPRVSTNRILVLPEFRRTFV